MSGGDVWRSAVMAGLVSVLALVVTAPPAYSSLINSLYNGPPALEKRTHKNFLRYGRGSELSQTPDDPYNSGSYSSVYDNLDDASLLNPALADVWAAKRAADKNFLRFGRGLASKNFIRFGRGDGAATKNVHRFSRSISRDDTASTDRFLEQESLKQPPRNKDIYFSMKTNLNDDHEDVSHTNITGKDNSQGGRMRSVAPANDQHDMVRSAASNEQGSLRSKRSPHGLFLVTAQSGLFSGTRRLRDDDLSEFSYGDGSSKEEEEETLSSQTIQDIQKRAFPLNFSRFGREPSDLNFIRFGKRGSDESDSSESGSHERSTNIAGYMGSAEDMEALLRARNNRNFLRYGRR